MPPVAAAGRLRKICKQIREILDSSDKRPGWTTFA